MTKIKSLDDILNNDNFGVLVKSKDENIFNLKHVPKTDYQREATDFIAKRKALKNFEEYKDIFVKCQEELKEGKRELVKFNERYFKDGSFFILKGILVYLESTEEKKKDKYHKLDARTKLIFENGTYSNMLLRSFGKGLYDDGYFVSEIIGQEAVETNPITDDDKQNGYIYVLQSLSCDDRLTSKRNLHKIGFSTTTVEIRIQNAKIDPTYLMADVKVIATYQVYNVNPHKLEQLIHRFFSNSCLDIDIKDGNGNIHRPREWFIVPLDVIDQAIELIINGEIIHCRYNDENEKIEC